MTKIFPRALTILLIQFCVALNIIAAESGDIRIRADQPGRYEVVDGDTLWDISGQFLEEPWLWPDLWPANPQIENPNLIYPGDTIGLGFVDGSPVFTLQRGLADVPTTLPTVRLSPQVRREVLRSPIPAISLENINSFLSRNRVVSRADLENAPYILMNEDGNLLSATGDTVLARGQWTGQVASYEIVRAGTNFTNPEGDEELGIKAELMGIARLISQENDLARLAITEVEQEIRSGDLLIATEASVIDSSYFPVPPAFQVSASILEIDSGLEYGSTYDTLVLDVGDLDNIQVGHLLTVQKPDLEVTDGNVRENLIFKEKVIFSGEKYATVLIYRVFDRTSLGVVLSSSEPIKISDKVVTP